MRVPCFVRDMREIFTQQIFKEGDSVQGNGVHALFKERGKPKVSIRVPTWSDQVQISFIHGKSGA